MSAPCQPEAPDCAIGESLDGQLQEPAKAPVNLCGAGMTLLIPLLARASDAVASHPVLCDPYAQKTLEKLNFDRDAMLMTPNQSTVVALRTRQFDRWTTAFLQKNPRATVVHLACGLDSRMQRVNWTESTRWIDVDLPEVIELRRQVLPNSIPGRDYTLLGADVLDRTWMQNIPTDRPTLIVMEGLLTYLVEDEVKSLLLQFCERFGQGEMLFECINTALLEEISQKPVKSVSEAGAIFQWAIDDPKSLEGIHPQLRMAESVSFAEANGVEKLTLVNRTILYLISWVPRLREKGRFLRFEFGKEE